MANVLVVAAHPDDEILGCGGTMAKLAAAGYNISVLILGEGITSRDIRRMTDRRSWELDELKKKAQTANTILGAKKVYFGDLPDNRFDSVDRLDVVKIVEKVKKEICPTIIFTHCERDLNVDHQITYEAVLTATRPMRGEETKRILAFEVLSSTEWRYPLSFYPNVFEDIEKFLPKKIKALEAYGNEMRKFPHPRSIEGVKINAFYRGMQSGYKYAEAFIGIRSMDSLKQTTQGTIIDSSSEKGIVSPIVSADLLAVFNLSNQRSVRMGSFNTQKISLEEHRKWFKKNITDPKVVMFKISVKNKFAGKLILNLRRNVAEVNIAIDEKYRRRGLATRLLLHTIEYLKQNHREVKTLKACIKTDNPQSIKLFSNCGFTKKRKIKIKGQKVYEYLYKTMLCAIISLGVCQENLSSIIS